MELRESVARQRQSWELLTTWAVICMRRSSTDTRCIYLGHFGGEQIPGNFEARGKLEFRWSTQAADALN